MTYRHAPESTYARSALSFLALLVLAAWASPALASAGPETLCDQAVNVADMPVPSSDKLTIDVVNHGPTDDIDAAPSIDDSYEESSATGRTKSRVEVLLRKIFDEPQLRTIDAGEIQESDQVTAPLAVDKTEAVDETTSDTNSEDSTSNAAGLPGVSEDDLARFKRQMYRTDI